MILVKLNMFQMHIDISTFLDRLIIFIYCVNQDHGWVNSIGCCDDFWHTCLGTVDVDGIPGGMR